MTRIFLLVFMALSILSCTPAQKPPQAMDILQYVDPFIGTGFHGHTFPGAVMPHGRVQLSPDTHLLGWDASSGYHYNDTTLYGFSHTHLSGTGIGDLGDILFLPYSDNSSAGKPVGMLDHHTESASPGYYKITVNPWNIQAELTATPRTGWHRYSYPSGQQARLMVDLAHILQPDWGHRVLEAEFAILDAYTISGYRRTTGWAADNPVYFRCRFNSPIVAHSMDVDSIRTNDDHAKGKNITAYLDFGMLQKPLEATVSISAVDAPGARTNMEEADNFDSFDAVAAAAAESWRHELSAIRIKSDDREVLTNFYTALYHTKMAPVIFSDLDGRYVGLDRKIHPADGADHYTIYSLWDTFRSWFPLMTIIEPKRAAGWARDLCQHFLDGGLLPKWPLNGNYTGTMVGYPAVAVLADAAEKGLADSLLNKMLEASVKSATWQGDFAQKHQDTRAARVMPKQIYYKETLGFVPMDQCAESVSYGLEMAYYDWCIAQLASLAKADTTAKKYLLKSKAYRKYFDASVGFMRGKNSDGSWDKNFNPRFSYHEKSAFVEGNAYQWTPFVPHDPAGLATLMGGRAGLGVWLDSLFMTSSKLVGEHASGDITGLIGQYAHGNEPSHHVPYLYYFSDRRWRTAEVLDTILYHFYRPEPAGIIGNEDCGQMSAWYVLNAMGIYQMTPGNTTFFIGRPIVDEANIRVQGGYFTISVRNNSRKNKYIKSVMLNKKGLKNHEFDYRDIRQGGLLEIVMTDIKPTE